MKKNYTWMIATMLGVGLMVGLVFSFSTVKAISEDPGPGSMSALAEDGYQLVTVSASNEPNSSGGIALSSSPAAVSAGCTLDTTNLVSYWPLDANYNDTIGTNNGSCTGTACPTTVTGAAADGRFFIDTDEDIVNVQSTTDFDWANDVDFSVGLWVKTTQDCSGNKVFFGRYRQGSTTPQGTWWLGCVPGGYARFHVQDSDSVVRRVTSSTAINDGKWHYIVGARNATTDENKIFIDGAERGMLNTPGYTGTFASNGVITMGGYAESSLDKYYLSGTLDEIAVFNVALTASDISTYLGTCPFPFVPNVGDVAFETEINLAKDITGAELLANSASGLSIDSIDPTSKQGGTISGSDPYTYTPPLDYIGVDFFSFVAIDGSSNTAEGNVIITVNPSAPEVVQPENQVNEEGETITPLQIDATDPQGQAMTYAATDLPPDLTIDENSGLISGTIADTASSGSPYDVTVTVTDTDANETSVNFTWTVNPMGSAPDVTNPGDQTNDEGDVISLQIVATDPQAQAMTYAATGLPLDLTINVNSGLISGTIADTASSGSPYNVTVTVTDTDANATSVDFKWTVNPNAPVVVQPENQENDEGETITPLQIEATDLQGQVMTYVATGLPPDLTIDENSGEISGTIADTASSGSPYDVTVTVTDTDANETSVNFTWTVNSSMNYIYLPIVIRQD